MKVKTIPSGWMRRDGRRFDCGPYMSGALEAKVRLEQLAGRKDRLADLTRGHNGGIYNGPHFSRNFVAGPDQGVPFLGSAAMLQADLSGLPYLRKVDAESPKLSYLKIESGMTLISCSGTIGRMVYARPDMRGMLTSQHIMKVVPDVTKIPSGYLYAFLSSKFGVSLVTSGTYGAIIQHIEPQHIADLPVPRLGDAVEGKVHELVEEAASQRAHSSRLLGDAIRAALDAWGVRDLSLAAIDGPDMMTPQASRLGSTLRFDAFFYGRGGALSDRVLEEIGARMPVRTLGELSEEVFETTRFGRKTVDDPAFGVPFLSISDLVRFDHRTDTLVSKKQVAAVRADVRSGWLILPRVGQLQGVFGTGCYIPRHLDGVGVSDNNIRIVPKSETDGAYLWAALSTKLLYQQIIRRACGTSIPYLDAKRVRQIPIPWPSTAGARQRVAERVIEAMECRSAASEAEDEARAVVERTIEEAS